MTEQQPLDKEELLAKYELGTYLNGLQDALYMTKPEIRRAIKTIIESEEDYND